MKILTRGVMLAACGLSAIPLGLAPVMAQDATPTLSSDEYLAYLVTLSTPQESKGSASTVGIPSGFSLPRGAGFIAGALSDVRREGAGTVGGDEADASAAFGLGFGDAAEAVGVEVLLSLESVDPSDFADSGSFHLKFSRQMASILPGQVAAVAIGASNLGAWGDSSARDESYYLAASTTFSVGNLPGLLSAGYSTAIGTDDEDDGGFIGVGLGVTDWLSVGTSWSGNEAIIGLTTTTKVFKAYDIQVGLSYGDVTHTESDGRWTLSMAIIDLDLF